MFILLLSLVASAQIQVRQFQDKETAGWAYKTDDQAFVAEVPGCRVQWNVSTPKKPGRLALDVREECPNREMWPLVSARVLEEIMKRYPKTDLGGGLGRWCGDEHVRERVAVASAEAGTLDFYEAFRRADAIREVQELFKPYHLRVVLSTAEKISREKFKYVAKYPQHKGKTVTSSAMCWFKLVKSPTIRVAVTVDDLPAHGPLPKGATRVGITKQVLQAFGRHGVRGAYAFINAGKLKEPGLWRVHSAWKEWRQPFANHTANHLDINKVSLEEYKADILANEAELRKLGGDWKYFRYPFLREGETLETRNAIRSFLKERGYTIAQVTIDFEDWSWNAPYARCFGQAEKVNWLRETYIKNAVDQLLRAEKLSAGLWGGSIPHVLLLHLGAFDAEMMDSLLTAYENEGVEWISLKEALSDPVYAEDPGLAAKNGSEFTYQIMKKRGLNLIEKYEGYPEKELLSVCL